MTNYKSIDLDDQKLITEFLEKYPQTLCQYTFSVLYTWNQGFFNNLYKIDDDVLFIKAVDQETKEECFLQPIGNITPQKLKSISENENIKNIVMVSDSFLATRPMHEWEALFDIEFEQNHSDYYYLANDLSELKGRKLSGKRNLIKQFFEANIENNIQILDLKELSPKDFSDIINEWCLEKDCEKDPSLLREKTALIRSFANLELLNLKGVAIKSNSEILGISLFEKLNKETAAIHFEKCKPGVKGIYQVINQESAKILEKEFKYINRESDEGIEGLRQAKMSYNPVNIEKAFVLNLK